MKQFALVLAGLLVAGSAMANDHRPDPTPAQVQAWQADQAKIKADFAKLPQAEQDRINAQNAAWEAQSLRENQHSH